MDGTRGSLGRRGSVNGGAPAGARAGASRRALLASRDTQFLDFPLRGRILHPQAGGGSLGPATQPVSRRAPRIRFALSVGQRDRRSNWRRGLRGRRLPVAEGDRRMPYPYEPGDELGHGTRLRVPDVGRIFGDSAVAGEHPRPSDIQYGLARPSVRVGIQLDQALVRLQVGLQVRRCM